jgi:DNA (cytosine-5)-methyltransferase 1
MGAHNASFSSDGVHYGFEHRWASDYDFDTCETYKKNVGSISPDCQVICSDVRDLDIEALPYADGLIYGFPCNDFSIVGKSAGLEGKFGPLYKYGVQYLDAHDPKFVVAENVSGLTSANAGNAFSQILQELSTAGKHGYRLTVHHYKFEDYGVPQARHRIIIVGVRKDLGLQFEVPAPSGQKSSAREAIENPPIASDAPNNELTKQSPIVVERLTHIAPGENAWADSIPEHLRLKVSGAKLSQIYKRLHPDRPSYTITGSGGGGTHVYHWEEPRALTNRERARLQTFDDNFVFVGSKESVRKQIGMAVPPKGASQILTALLKTLAGKSYDSIPPSEGYL